MRRQPSPPSHAPPRRRPGSGATPDAGTSPAWRIIEFCQSPSLIKRCLLAFAAGAIATLALPPAYIFPAFFVSFPVLVWLSSTAGNKKQAFLTGWSFGFGYFTLGLYWIAFALFVDIKTWWWALPFAVFGLPSIFALYSGLAVLATHIFFRRGGHQADHGLAYVLAFSAIWTFFEFLRGHMFTGFPWNLPGYVWTGYLPMLQNVAFIGIYGLSLLTVLAAALPAAKTRQAYVFSIAILLTLFTAGELRLLTTQNPPPTDTLVRIVQPNIPQTMKWDPALQNANFIKSIKLSELPSARGLKPSVVLWPETAVGFNLQKDAEARALMGKTLPPDGILLTGALRFGDHEDVYNSLAAVTPDGAISGWADKFHLVPFGEYIPFRNILNLTPIAAGISNIGDFSTGKGPHTVRLPNMPAFSPLICYEVIFPNAVSSRQDRPQLLVNITNDGWYGHTAGPHQHFAIAQTRAVEEGLPLLRAANTGISGVVDGFGKITDSMDLGKTGVIDVYLPSPLPETLLTKVKNLLYFIGSILLFISSAYIRNRLPT